MRHWLSALVGVAIAAMLMSCTSSYESKGNTAYRAAQKVSGDPQRRLHKEAYIYYQKAVKSHPKRVSNTLRNRYLEMTLTRADMVLIEGSSTKEALPLFMEDIDSLLTPSVDPQQRERYASFLVTLADSSIARGKLYQGLRYLDKAIGVSGDKATIEQKKENFVGSFAAQNFDLAEVELENAISNEDANAQIRAEFYVDLAVYYDPSLPGAAELQSKIRERNLSCYSAYEAVVDDKPDSNVYDEINKYDILLAVSAHSGGANTATLKIEMYNYSYNPLRLRATDFSIVDVDGKKYKALSSCKIDTEILDQEHEVKMTLRFPKKAASIKKLVYENGEHYTEKFFF